MQSADSLENPFRLCADSFAVPSAARRSCAARSSMSSAWAAAMSSALGPSLRNPFVSLFYSLSMSARAS